MNQKKSNQSKIVFYDGNCPLCHWVVKFLIKIDRSSSLSYAPLQGATALQVLEPKLVKYQDLSTVIFWDENQDRLFKKSEAIIQILKHTSGLCTYLSAILRLIPSTLLDWAYDLISKNRHHVFGQYVNCPLPSAKHKDQFLN